MTQLRTPGSGMSWFAAAVRSEPIPTRALIAGLLSVATLMLVASCYYPYVPDDAFISLRYARRLIQGLGLTFTEGERVEGYSNLLWVLAVSAPGAARAGADRGSDPSPRQRRGTRRPYLLTSRNGAR